MKYRKSSSLAGTRGMTRVKAIIGIIVLLAVSMGVGMFLGRYQVAERVKEWVAPPFGGKTLIRLLVLGEDNTGGKKDKPRGLSDTILLASIDLSTKRVSAISIPRDTKIELDGQTRKVNAAYSVGGPARTEQVIMDMTGIKPDYYVKTNVAGFEKTVDILGGVDIDVEKNMRYNDNWGHLHINLKKGLQHLDGNKAMQYVRFRHDALGDITRMQRQQKFLKALVQQSMSASKLTRLPAVIGSMLRNCETDMTPKDVLYLAKFASKTSMSQVKMDMLPGAPENINGASYWVYDPERTAQLVRELFIAPGQPQLPTVEVLNGSGVAGAAGKIADALKEKGYQVVSIGNADSFGYESSRIISHRKDVQGVDGIAGILNSNDMTEDEAKGPPKADVTVIVGKDAARTVTGT